MAIKGKSPSKNLAGGNHSPSGRRGNSLVNSPRHYNAGRFETIEIIEDIIQNYESPIDGALVGNIIRYLSRAPLKDSYKRDLRKAQWYMNRLCARQREEGIDE